MRCDTHDVHYQADAAGCPYCEDAQDYPQVRKFDTGATRDTDQGKLDYDGFFSPQVLERRARFMHKHRKQADGQLRDGGNWKRGIPKEQYLKSLLRHVMDVWKEMSGIRTQDGLEEAICASMFNLEGLLYEVLKSNPEQERRTGDSV